MTLGTVRWFADMFETVVVHFVSPEGSGYFLTSILVRLVVIVRISPDWIPGLASNPRPVPNFGNTEQTCQPLCILRNHYAFRVSNTPLRKPVQNVGKLRILRNFGAIRPIPRNLQQLSWLAVSRKSPAGQNVDEDLFILRLPSHRRQISPSDQQRELQRWSHAQWNVVLNVNRSNAGGSSPTWSPASPVYRTENTDEDSVNVTIRP